MFKISIFLLGLLFLVSCTHDAINHSTEEEKELNIVNPTKKCYDNSKPQLTDYYDIPHYPS